MAELIQHLMNPGRGIERIAETLRAPARRWLCAGVLLTLAPLCQAQGSDLQLPQADPSPWSSGVRTKQATNSITAAGTANGPLVINGTSQATFIAGSQINLEPGFHADGSTGATFHAFIAPVVPPGTDTVIRTGVKSTGSY